jgi:hypothetical protein
LKPTTLIAEQDVRDRDTSAFKRVFDALRPGITARTADKRIEHDAFAHERQALPRRAPRQTLEQRLVEHVESHTYVEAGVIALLIQRRITSARKNRLRGFATTVSLRH